MSLRQIVLVFDYQINYKYQTFIFANDKLYLHMLACRLHMRINVDICICMEISSIPYKILTLELCFEIFETLTWMRFDTSYGYAFAYAYRFANYIVVFVM